MGLFKALDKAGIDYEKTTVGDKYVNEAMVANGYVLGGEQSGHIIFSKHATTGDGILTAIMLMEVILEKKQSLHTLAQGMKMYPQCLKNVRVADKKAVTENAKVQQKKKKIEEKLGEDGRILLRESGTEPVIRVMVEAATDALCEQYVDEMVEVDSALENPSPIINIDEEWEKFSQEHQLQEEATHPITSWRKLAASIATPMFSKTQVKRYLMRIEAVKAAT